jgi:HPt (histidine-containing phosphotransfer) domain-containing protein
MAEGLDRAVLDELLAMTGGDPAFLAELIDSYLEDAPKLLQSMHEALANGDAETLRRSAHSLKSNSASFGAFELARRCQALEDLAKRGDLALASEALAGLEAELDKVRPALLEARPEV